MKNRLIETLDSTNDSTDQVGSFPAFLVGNEIAIYSISYNYLRCMEYHTSNDAVVFTSEGKNFVIRGKNMRHLLNMLNGRMISRIIENDSMKIGGKDVTITSVIVSPVKQENTDAE